jgi:hypothetical protein
MQKLRRLLMPIVVAVFLGPLIAGLTVCVLATANNLLDPADSLPVVDLFKMFGFSIVFAYISGAGIALLAGMLVSIWMMFRPPSLIAVIAAALRRDRTRPGRWTSFTISLPRVRSCGC